MMFNAKALALGAILATGSAGIATAAPAVVTGDLNLRAGPGTGYGVVTVMPAGATVNARGCDGSWCRVTYGGRTGFASSSYLDVARRSYARAPVYAPAPVYAAPVYVEPDYAPAPVFGFGIGFGRHWGGWHHRGWRHRGWRHHRW